MPSARRSRRWPDMGRSAVGTAWTRPADVRDAVHRRWPVLLINLLAGQDWEPLPVPLRGPGPAEVGERLADVQVWAAEWERASLCCSADNLQMDI